MRTVETRISVEKERGNREVIRKVHGGEVDSAVGYTLNAGNHILKVNRGREGSGQSSSEHGIECEEDDLGIRV